MLLLHRKYEYTRSYQGFNWFVDEYTKFGLIILIWRLKFYFRIRRNRDGVEFNEAHRRFIYYFEFLDLYKNGFCRIDRKLDLWENFDSDIYRIGNKVYKIEELPLNCLEFLAEKFPTRRYQKLLDARSV